MHARAVLLMSALTTWAVILLGCHASPDGVATPSPQPPSGTPPTAAACDSVKARFTIGERATNDLLERARVAAQAERARFLRPNQPVTREFLSTRLNLNLDSQDIVQSATCG
jgi:hypothetical protein